MDFQPNLSPIFIDTDKLIVKLIWQGKRTIITKTILKKSNKVGETTLSGFKIYYKTTATNSV